MAFLVSHTEPLRVLFLCTHNSARSILAEALLNHLGAGRFQAFSAGSSPRAHQRPNPLALRVLESSGIATTGLRSKSWDEFAGPDAAEVDLVITVCDNAAGEQCPFWPGAPATAHWSHADPSEVQGSEEEKLEAFRRTMYAIRTRVQLLLAVPPERLTGEGLQREARALAGA